MLDLQSFIDQNTFTIGLLIGSAVFIIGSIWAFVYGIRHPEPEYYMGIRFVGRPRTVFLVAVALVTGISSVYWWKSMGIFILCFLIFNAITFGVKKYLAHRKEKRSYQLR